MKRTLILLVIAVLVSAAKPTHGDDTTFRLELEGGAIWQTSNNVQISNDEDGTRFSLKDLAGTGPWPAGRLLLTWEATPRHGFRLLLAPFSITETGTFAEEVRFAGETYAADVPTEATYQFDSWRLTYRYQLRDSERWTVWVGFTAKIRDARVELRQGDRGSRDTDLGFVPLAHLSGEWRFADQWRLEADLDALAGGPGRAIDLALKVGYDLTERWSVTGGYRLLEGGADTDDVYNFAWFDQAVLSVVAKF